MDKRSSRALLTVFAALLAVAAASACGSDDGGTTKKAPRELVVGFGARIITLDPDQALDPPSLAMLRLIGGTMYELDRKGEPFPVLHDSVHTSPDGLTWSFRLKKGLTFSDGSRLTTEDVEATFARAKRDEANAYAGFLAPIESVKAESPRTVVFRLERPYPSLPDVLSQPEMAILPSEGLAKGKKFFDAPISAGPYRLESWGGGATASAVRNRSYPGPTPTVEHIVFRTVEDANARIAQVRSGQLDFAHDVPPRLVANIKAPLVVKARPIFGFISIPLNNDRAPFDDPRVRRALALAIDREQINDAVWNGGAVPLAGFWPSTMDGFDEDVPVDARPEEARALLKGTECASGCRIALSYSSEDSWAEGTALAVVDNLKQIGIDVQLEKSDNAGTLDALLNQRYDMQLTFLYDYSNMPDGMLDFGFGPSLNANFSGYKSPPELKRIIETAVTSTGDERDAALAQVNEQFLKDQPYVTLETLTFTTVSRYDDEVVALDSSGFVAIERSSN